MELIRPRRCIAFVKNHNRNPFHIIGDALPRTLRRFARSSSPRKMEARGIALPQSPFAEAKVCETDRCLRNKVGDGLEGNMPGTRYLAPVDRPSGYRA